MNIDITVFLPLIDAISQYAATHNTDLTTATFDITNKLQAYRNLDVIYVDIEEAKQRLSIFGEQKQIALTVLMSLMDKGITESQIALLATDNWQQHQQQITDGNDNLQPNNGSHNPGNNNGDSGFSMSDYICLNLLKGSTANMLNKMATSC